MYVRLVFRLCLGFVLVGSLCVKSCDDDGTRLYQACESGNLDLVEKLLNSNINPNSMSTELYDRGCPAIDGAITSRNLDVVKKLIEHKADVNFVYESGVFPLWWATSICDGDDIVEYLLEKNALPNGPGPKPCGDPLIKAACYSNNKSIELLLAAKADVNAQNQHGETALIKSLNGPSMRLDTVKILVEAGAEVNCQDCYGMSPLLYACHGDDIKAYCIVRYLIKQKADIYHVSNNRTTALLQARHNFLVKSILVSSLDREKLSDLDKHHFDCQMRVEKSVMESVMESLLNK